MKKTELCRLNHEPPFCSLLYNVHTDTVLVGILYSFKFKLTSPLYNRITNDVVNYADQINNPFSRILFPSLPMRFLATSSR